MKDNPVSKNMRCINKNTIPKQPPLPRNLEKGSCNYFVQDLFYALIIVLKISSCSFIAAILSEGSVRASSKIQPS